MTAKTKAIQWFLRQHGAIEVSRAVDWLPTAAMAGGMSSIVARE